MSAENTSQISGLRSYIDNKVPMAKAPKIAMAYVSCKWDGTVATITKKRAFGDLFDVSRFSIDTNNFDLYFWYNRSIDIDNIYVNGSVISENSGWESLVNPFEIITYSLNIAVRILKEDFQAIEIFNHHVSILVLGDW